jgi:hypothetical protein
MASKTSKKRAKVAKNVNEEHVMHFDTKKYNKAQAPGDRAICQLLAEQIDRHLPEAENKIWPQEGRELQSRRSAVHHGR